MPPDSTKAPEQAIQARSLKSAQLERSRAGFDDALAFHRQGQLEQAECIYREILDIDPKHSDAIHLLGVIAYQVGQYQTSVTLFSQNRSPLN